MMEAWFSASEMMASLCAEQRLEQAAIGVEAGGEEDGIVLAEPLRDALLERAVQRLRPADEAHGGHAEAEFVERIAGRGDDLGIVGKAEIVVGAEVDQLALAALRGASAMRICADCGEVISRSRL